MAQLVQNSTLEIDRAILEIEHKAFLYNIMNAAANIVVNVALIYFASEASTYVWRILTCPC